MEAGQELDKLIAEKLGWTDVAYIIKTGLNGSVFNIYQCLVGIPPGETERTDVPCYSTDLNAAASLPKPDSMYHKIIIVIVDNTLTVRYVNVWDGGAAAIQSGEDEALLRCLAWLEYQKYLETDFKS